MMFGKPGEKAPQVSFQIPKGIDLVCFRSSQHWFSSSVGANNSCALLPDPTVVLFFLRIYQFFYGKGRCVYFPVIKTPQKGGDLPSNCPGAAFAQVNWRFHMAKSQRTSSIASWKLFVKLYASRFLGGAWGCFFFSIFWVGQLVIHGYGFRIFSFEDSL